MAKKYRSNNQITLFDMLVLFLGMLSVGALWLAFFE